MKINDKNRTTKQNRINTSDKIKFQINSEKMRAFVSNYRLLIFFVTMIIYLELIYRLWIFKNLNADFFFPVLFSLSLGTLIYLIVCLLPRKAALPVTTVSMVILILCSGTQLIYFCIFRTPLSLASIEGAGDAFQFIDIVFDTILKNLLAVVLLFLPLAVPVIYKGKLVFTVRNKMSVSLVLLFGVLSYALSILFVSLTGDSPVSQNTLYFNTASLELTANKLGIFTTMRLDLQRLAVGDIGDNLAIDQEDNGGNTEGNDNEGQQDTTVSGGSKATGGNKTAETSASGETADAVNGETSENGNAGEQTAPAEKIKPFNTMDIDFETLLASGEKDPDYAMHKYFSTVTPTASNKYTGMFKGDNLILLTAEGFSPYAISPELTPTLYMMTTEGFVFKNFYNPVWGVSTSDGEYVACTGLIPKSGIWSFAASGKNYMPFTMGNQFRKLGYLTKAYHDHTYTYYKRNISHPNMGYDYKGVGNGLVVKKTWPESDLEMINVTAGDYINNQPFHTYYMTVSGHMNYTFTGNYMASKNKSYVADLPYSDPAKAYIACNLELEFALAELIKKLEAAGIAEKTVIALSPDHYPYGLPRENLDELAGHKVEENFELYKSTFILWKKGMKPVIVDKPCASLDINPTLSNLFGLEYDSRLLMGTDILSDTPPLVIFSNRSWITDRAMYNSKENKVAYKDGTTEDKAYVRKINKMVADKFKYSAKILETDYYRKILP